MVIIDTSVWIAYFRGASPKIVVKVKELLDQDTVALAVPVRIEILSGSSKQHKPSLNRVLSALPLFYPSQNSWKKMEEWIDMGLAKGQRFGALDLLIAAIAAEQDAILWSLDEDFGRMEKLGWIKRF